MNWIWSGMILVSLITAVATGRVDETIEAVFEGASTSVSTLISFAGAMCFWSGIMKVAESSGIAGGICKIISPVVNRLFPNCGETAKRHISMNMTANFLGMGNAATPMGMLAAQELDRENPVPHIPSDAICMLVVINTASIQIMPTTILALRSAAGSQNPMSVILPIWLVSAFSATVGVLAVKLLKGRKSL